MPQLPQVQTVRRFLSQSLLKPKPKKIKNIIMYYPSIIKQPQPTQFTKILIGQTFTSISRYGKFLILKLKTHSIISHLRMEGKYQYYKTKPKITKHNHIQFIMTDGSSLIYSDTRKFGTMHLVQINKQMSHKTLSKLGPQVNSQYFTPQYLKQICKNNSHSIRDVLLNQQNVCGMGNIYVHQILFAAGIHPQTKAKFLTNQKIQLIITKSKYIIDKAIINKGTTFRSFLSNNSKGQFQNCLQVYNRTGQQCYQCGNTLLKVMVKGRGSHFCPQCQPKIH